MVSATVSVENSGGVARMEAFRQPTGGGGASKVARCLVAEHIFHTLFTEGIAKEEVWLSRSRAPMKSSFVPSTRD